MSSFLFLTFPLGVAAYSIWRLRGAWRLAAIACLPGMLSAWALDMQGLTKGGRLAGIYTIMLIKPFLVSLLILYGTYIAAYRAKLFQNAAARYAVATLSSVFLFGGVVYLWIFSSLSLAVPYVADVVGRMPGVLYLYRAVGGVLALAIAVYAFRTTVKPESTEELGHPKTALSRSSFIRYTIATLSSLFHFAGVMYLVYGYTPLAFPQLRQTNRWGLFAGAGLMALVAAAHSFRATVMTPRKSREPEARPDD